jgi:hypothetical protein
MGVAATKDTLYKNSTGGQGPLGIIPYKINAVGPLAVRDRVCTQPPSIITALGAATTQIIAAPTGGSFTHRICALVMSNTNATATTVSLVTGTGVNCVTGTTTLLPPITLSANTGSAPNFSIVFPEGSFLTPQATAAICATGSAAGAVNIALIVEND